MFKTFTCTLKITNNRCPVAGDGDRLISFFIVSLNLTTTKDAGELLNAKYITLSKSSNYHESFCVFCAPQISIY